VSQASTPSSAATPERSRLGAIFLTIFLDLLGFGLVLPFLAEESRQVFGTTEFVGSLLAASYSLMQFIFVPVWGRLSDRIGRRPVMLWSVFASALGMGGLFLALVFGNSPVWLFLARIATGIATANLGTAGAYIGDVTKPEDRAKGMGMIGAAFGLGFIIGPGVGGMLAEYTVNGRHGAVPCLLAATLSLINTVWVWRGLPESLPPEKRNREPRRVAPLDIAGLRRVFSRPGVGLIVLVNFVAILSFTNLNETFRFFTKDTFDMDRKHTGFILAFIGVVAVLVQGGLIRRLSGKVSEVLLLRVGLFMQTAGFLVLAYSPSLGHWSLYLSGGILAFGNGMAQPSVSAYISKRAAAHEQGEFLSSVQSMASFARMMGPAMAGMLYTTLGHRTPYFAAACGMTAAGVLALGLANRDVTHERS
jgi:MFS transporter, DHA1 family, tetracycline resistance protein